jgi:tetratricopeptide (TPR) repeat protein
MTHRLLNACCVALSFARPRLFLFFVLCLFVEPLSSLPARATNSAVHSEILLTARQTMDEGIALQQPASLTRARAQFERLYQTSSDLNALYYLTYTECWLCLLGVSEGGDRALVKQYLDQAIEHAETLVKLQPLAGEPKAILATLYGIRLKNNALNIFIVGPKLESLVNQALELEPNNPRVLYVHGNALFYKPAIFGGGVKKALEVWKRAVALYEKERQADLNSNDGTIKHRWGYLETLAALGQCYEAIEEWENARATYKRGLAAQPNYKWIRHELLPNLEQKYPSEARRAERK